MLGKLLLAFISVPVFASSIYTVNEVSTHNVPNDCWVIYGENVYDLSQYIPSHDKFMDIREWCGKDMTVDFETKAGIGRDHRESSYELLNRYLIGSLVTEKENLEEQNINSNPYNLFIPLFSTIVLYWSSYFLFKRSIKKFNAFWNTILLLTLLIPAFGFGIFMILRYQFPNLYDVKFDFMYWHVELSIVMGTLCICHLIQRLRQYLVQFKK